MPSITCEKVCGIGLRARATEGFGAKGCSASTAPRTPPGPSVAQNAASAVNRAYERITDSILDLPDVPSGGMLYVTWNDLGPRAQLIATTKKNAKGESVCSRTSTLAPFGSRVFSFSAGPPPDAGGIDERLARNIAGWSLAR